MSPRPVWATKEPDKLDPSTPEAGAADLYKFVASLLYKGSSRTASAT